MLRRPPTAITITQDDIARYEEARQQRIEAHQRAQQSDSFAEPAQSRSRAANGPADTQRTRTAEQRIMGR